MSNTLIEAGLKLASSKSGNDHIGSIWVDRTIYHTIQVEDADGNKLFDKSGNPVVLNTAYVSAGMSVSSKVYEIALEKEKEFSKLNELFRKHMDEKGIKWRISKGEQTAISISRANS